jgi:hypothetical protein
MGTSDSSVQDPDIDTTLKNYEPPVTINTLWQDFVTWVTNDIWLETKEAYFFMRLNLEYTYIISSVITVTPYVILMTYAAIYSAA